MPVNSLPKVGLKPQGQQGCSWGTGVRLRSCVPTLRAYCITRNKAEVNNFITYTAPQILLFSPSEMPPFPQEGNPVKLLFLFQNTAPQRSSPCPQFLFWGMIHTLHIFLLSCLPPHTVIFLIFFIVVSFIKLGSSGIGTRPYRHSVPQLLARCLEN